MRDRMAAVALASLVGACATQGGSSSDIEALKANVAGLNERVTTLEQQQQQPASAGAPAPSAPAQGAPGSAATANPAAPPPAAPPASSGITPSPPPAQAETPVTPTTPSPPAETGLEPESTHALERALVLTGNLLLPPNTLEVQPSLSYSYSESLSVVAIGGTLFTQRIRTDEASGTLTARYGLPYASQFNLSLPSPTWVRTGSNSGQVTQNAESTGGFTDMSLELDHQFLDDRPWQPAVIGFVEWQPPTASGNIDSFFAPSTVNVRPFSRSVGFDIVEGGFNLVKRIDPVVFTAGYSHDFRFSQERNGFNVDPGDQNNFNAGAILAVSPDISFRAGVSLSYDESAKLNNVTLAGSDDVIGSFNTGISVALTERVLLDVAVSAGLTPDASNFAFTVSLPIRF
jgi:hypothetical protein